MVVQKPCSSRVATVGSRVGGVRMQMSCWDHVEAARKPFPSCAEAVGKNAEALLKLY